MEEDLDHILLQQYHSCKRSLKVVKKLKTYYGHDPNLDNVEKQIHLKMDYCIFFMKNKDIIKKKPKKVKKVDCLSRNPIYEMYRTSYMMTVFSYQVFTQSVQSYLSYFRKK